MDVPSTDIRVLARIATNACNALIECVLKMDDDVFFREYHDLAGLDLFGGIPTSLEWIDQRYRSISRKRT